jgi:hypothetical protein
MSFTHLETKSSSVGAASASATLDVAASAGDFLVMYVARTSSSVAAEVVLPSGFVFDAAVESSQRFISIATKEAVGGETTFTVTQPSAVGIGFAIQRWAKNGAVTKSAPLSPIATNGTSITAGPVTTAIGALCVGAHMWDGSSTLRSTTSDGFASRSGALSVSSKSYYPVDKIATSTAESFTGTLTGQVTRQSAVLMSYTDGGASGPDYTQRKSSTFDATHTLGTITTATLNAVNVFDHVSSQAAGTVSFTGAITDEITTSGVVNLVLGDGAATQTQTVQVNVFGVVPSNNPAQRDGAAMASLTGVQIRITAGANLNGTQVYYSGTETTNASGNFSTLDVSPSAAVAADPVLMQVLTAAGDSITSAETVELI